MLYFRILSFVLLIALVAPLPSRAEDTVLPEEPPLTAESTVSETPLLLQEVVVPEETQQAVVEQTPEVAPSEVNEGVLEGVLETPPLLQEVVVPTEMQQAVVEQTPEVVLEDTTDPSALASEGEVVAVGGNEEGTEGVPLEEGVSHEEVPLEVPSEEAPLIVAEVPSAPEESEQSPVVESIPSEELEPEAEFSFSIQRSNIPAKKTSRARGDSRESGNLVTSSPTVTADPLEQTLSVSGSCSAQYFVVLLYAKQDDYYANPNSYILNKAFDCPGTFSYAISDLPPTLESGVYYLLIGEQGERGSWTPITGLTEIVIIKSL